MKPFHVTLMMVFASLGCTRAPDVVHTRWSRTQSAEMPAALTQLVPEINRGTAFELGNEQKVVRVQQRVNGVPVENTSVQVILNSKGEIDYASMATLEEVPEAWAESLEKIRSRRGDILRRWRGGAGKRWINLPTEVELLVIQRANQQWIPALRIRVIEEVQGQVRDYFYHDNGQLADERVTSLSGVDGVARVFLGPPDRSVLNEEILAALAGDGTLTGQLIRQLSADGKVPVRPNNDFRFNPDQREFDDVQAYYFADQQARWFASLLNLKLHSRLEIKLHVGAPVPGNAMFYYANQVRLGDGDGVTYRGIPRDPSIVKHEVSHAYVEAISGLGFEGEPGSYSEAFSDLFTALADDNPIMGGYAYVGPKGRRTIENDLRADKDIGKGKYENSLVVSGTFWEIKQTLGAEPTARLAKGFLARLGPQGRFADFHVVFADAVKAELNPEQQAIALAAVDRRGWRAK